MIQFLLDSKGQKSSARLHVAVWSLGVFAVWAGACIYKGDVLDIPVGVGAVVAAVVGGKTVQSFAERDK